MPTFVYTATNSSGKVVRGKISAANGLDLEDRLSSLGLTILEQRSLKAGKGRFMGGIKEKDLIMLCVHLEQLERAGVPLLDSISDLRDTSGSPYMRDLMADIYENVKNGALLSEALKNYPNIFKDVFVGLVAAGEKTGRLADSFRHLTEHLKWTADLKRKVKKAVRYPIALLFMMTGVIGVMMTFVVPQLSDFLLSQGFDLPWYTYALIAFSNAVVDYWYLMLGIPIFSFVTLMIAVRVSQKIRLIVDVILLKSPLIGPVVLKTNLARFTRFFSVTFSSGIDVLECLDTANKVVNNNVIKNAVADIRKKVFEGSSLTAAIQGTQHFPGLVIRMFKVGEDSGDMESALENVNFFYDREVNDAVDTMVGLIQPLLTIVMGLLMLWVTASVFGPLYDSFSKMDI